MTILSSLAQQESESLSQNVKLGYQYRFQKGKVNVNYNRFLGYTKGEDGKLEIVPEEAEIVKRIYREYLEGGSTISIAKGLGRDGIRNGAGNTKWQGTNIQQILSNEKYIGDALLQKTVTIDTLQKKRVKNVDHMPQYYVRDDHPAIIPRELFYEVQAEMTRRAELRREGRLNQKYCSHIAMSGKVICGECGAPFQRTHWILKGEKVIVWRCRSRLQKGKKSGCHSRTIREADLQKAFVKAVQDLILDEDRIYNDICSDAQELTTGNTDIECGAANCDLHKQHFWGGKNDRIKRQVVNQHHIPAVNTALCYHFYESGIPLIAASMMSASMTSFLFCSPIVRASVMTLSISRGIPLL